MAHHDPAETDDTTPEHVVVDVPAPIATEALLLRTPAGEWKQVLDGEPNIERDEVALMLGDLETGQFEGWRRSWYADHETVVLPADHEVVREHRDRTDTPIDSAEDLIAAVETPRY